MSRRAWMLFALLSFMWGVPYLMVKMAVAEVSVPFLVFATAGPPVAEPAAHNV